MLCTHPVGTYVKAAAVGPCERIKGAVGCGILIGKISILSLENLHPISQSRWLER